MRRYKTLILSLAIYSCANSSYASIVDNGLYTTDTETGLDWLDATETTDMSYNDITSYLASGGMYANTSDWRHATGEELQVLLGHMTGNYSTSFDLVVVDKGSMAFVTETLGVTDKVTYHDRTIGVLEDIRDSNESRWVAYLSATTGLGNAYYDVHYFSYEPDNHHDRTGHFLVRGTVVPLPAAAWLFGSGFLGLIGMTMRKRAV